MQEIELIKEQLNAAKAKIANVAGDVSSLLAKIVALQAQVDAGANVQAELAEVAALAGEINDSLAVVDAQVEPEPVA